MEPITTSINSKTFIRIKSIPRINSEVTFQSSKIVIQILLVQKDITIKSVVHKISITQQEKSKESFNHQFHKIFGRIIKKKAKKTPIV